MIFQMKSDKAALPDTNLGRNSRDVLTFLELPIRIDEDPDVCVYDIPADGKVVLWDNHIERLVEKAEIGFLVPMFSMMVNQLFYSSP